MKTIIFLATSLDGYIAKENGDIEWLVNIQNPDRADYGFNAFMERIDAIIMGRNTFDKVMEMDIWPYIKPVFVLSNSLWELPSDFEGKAEIIKGNPTEILEKMNKLSYRTLYIDGGKTIQAFLKEDLIDEIIISRIPIILGNGIPLFNSMQNEILLEHVNTEVYKNGLVKSHYIKMQSSR